MTVERFHKYAILEGVEQGLQQGREIGMQQGREIGMQQGREIGLQEGRIEGMQQGLQEGSQQKALETAKKMLENGKLSIEEIAHITDLELTEIQKIKDNFFATIN